MITVELNAKKEPCSQCGHENNVYALQSLFQEASEYNLFITLLCTNCGNHRMISAKVKITDNDLRNGSVNELSKDEAKDEAKDFNEYAKSSVFAITLPAPLDKPMEELGMIPMITDGDQADKMILDAINLLIKRQNALVEIVAAQALKAKL